MDLEAISKLGDSLRKEYQALHSNEEHFTALAVDHLQKLDFDFAWAPELLASVSLANPSVPSHRFSDWPIQLYRSQEFYIELLVWTNATAAIHQHSFSGAFKVVQGSSFHALYDFNASEEVNADLVLGDVTCREFEKLSVGDVRPIKAGSAMTHSLYHLDHPSATLVVRTNGHPKFAPQFTLYKNHIAVNQLDLARKGRVNYCGWVLDTLMSVDEQKTYDVLGNLFQEISVSEAVVVILAHRKKLFREDIVKEPDFLVDNGIAQPVAEAVVNALEELNGIDELTEMRNLTSDPELRYFLALLINVPDQHSILAQLQTAYPDDDPLDTFAGLLVRVCDERTEFAKRMLSNAASMMGGTRQLDFSNSLFSCLPEGIEKRDRKSFFRHALGVNANVKDNVSQAGNENCKDSNAAHRWRESIDQFASLHQLKRIVN